MDVTGIRVDGPLPVTFAIIDGRLAATIVVPCVVGGEAISLTMYADIDHRPAQRQCWELARRLYVHEMSEWFRVGDEAPFLPEHEHGG